MTSPATRLSDYLFLLGIRDLEPLSRLNQLPTIRQVILRFHYHLHATKSVRNASHATIEEISLLWSRASIPARLTKHGVEKIEKIHSDWLLLKKNKARTTKAQKEREREFVDKLDILFDIAHADASSMIKIDEDCQFLLDQRDKRKMIMTNVDKELAMKQERSVKRQKEEEERRCRAAAKDASTSRESTSRASTSSYIPLPEMEESSVSSNDNASEVEEEYTPITPSSRKKKCVSISERKHIVRSKKGLYTSQVTSALDRNKISDREALRLMIPLAAALGQDPSSLSISRTTIQRERKKARKEFAEDIKETFQPSYPLVVHWDGKILPDIIGIEKVDRLPVLVSGDGKEKLLGVPKLPSGTGENAAESIYNVLQQWNVADDVQGMSFDTTSVNTGNLKGACVLLEEKLGRELLWLACRHHIMELILAKVFSLCLGPSNSPDIPLFKRFKTVWNGIKRDNFQTLHTDSEADYFKQNTLEYLSKVDNWESQPRDDYQELIELTLTVIGNSPSKMHWRTPGPVHHARWMAKLIYAIKIYLFRNQKEVFKLTQREEMQIKRFVTFGALVYTSAWIHAPLPTEAPANDLKLWLDLRKYEVIDEEISKASRKVLERHLWYLSDELVGLAIFSDRVTDFDKKEIVSNMNVVEATTRIVRGNPAPLQANQDPILGHFATSRTIELFHKMKIETSFLALDPQQWKENEDFVNGKVKVKTLRVVNDTAERGVKLFEDFNKILTKNEEEKQFLLQVVEANRKVVPTKTTKKAALDALKS